MSRQPADADLDIDMDTSLAEAHELAHSAEHELTQAVPKGSPAIKNSPYIQVHSVLAAEKRRPGARYPNADTPPTPTSTAVKVDRVGPGSGAGGVFGGYAAVGVAEQVQGERALGEVGALGYLCAGVAAGEEDLRRG